MAAIRDSLTGRKRWNTALWLIGMVLLSSYEWVIFALSPMVLMDCQDVLVFGCLYCALKLVKNYTRPSFKVIVPLFFADQLVMDLGFWAINFLR